jgi:1-acyl-sn-glycerol-3-phosphate acyltransferase
MSQSLPAPATARGSALAPQARGFHDGHPFFVLTQWMVAGALHLLADVTARGMERCPAAGPVLLAANHLSYVDIPLVGAWAPRTTIFFSKMEVNHYPVVGWIGRTYGTIFVRRGEADRQAIREALASLAAGQMIGVYPEGHRSHGRGLLPAQPGIALLAQRSNALVWPVAITGTEAVGKRLRPKVTITGGEPFDALAVAAAEHGPRPTHEQVTSAIMGRIAALLPERYRGAYR